MDPNGYRLLLPERTLDYSCITDVKESSTEIVIYLEEKNEIPDEYANVGMESKGGMTRRWSRTFLSVARKCF